MDAYKESINNEIRDAKKAQGSIYVKDISSAAEISFSQNTMVMLLALVAFRI